MSAGEPTLPVDPPSNGPMMQAMLNSGLNAFAAKMLVESYAQERDATGVRRAKQPPPRPIHCVLDGVVLSLAPALARRSEREPAAALWAVVYHALGELGRQHGITTVMAHTDAVTRARVGIEATRAQLLAETERQLAALTDEGPLGYRSDLAAGGTGEVQGG